ncbi:hypothetical protein [Embleya sp. AB8]|uniref:hypothetical protein n=1 Tax=Embleya sp. AB8 TaxID=3156304 RepID=UPI003C713A6E
MTSLAVQLAVEESKVTPGLLGFVVVAGIAVATWFLLKSMNRQLKRVDFEQDGKPAEAKPVQRTEDNGAPVA